MIPISFDMAAIISQLLYNPEDSLLFNKLTFRTLLNFRFPALF